MKGEPKLLVEGLAVVNVPSGGPGWGICRGKCII